MARTVYYAAASLDGFIAGTEETLTWLTGFEGAGYAGGEASTPMGEGGSYVPRRPDPPLRVRSARVARDLIGRIVPPCD